MAFLRTFSALIVAALVWMGLFLEFGEVDIAWLNSVADWISPLTVGGWLFYGVLCVGCFLLAQRLIGRGADIRHDGDRH